MTSVLSRGVIAGTAGTATLNAITYADMMVRGRGASDVPARTVEALAGDVGLDVPGRGEKRRNRLESLGALSGTLAGLSVAVGSAALRQAGLRLPAVLDAALVGGAAMAVTDGPAVAAGVVDPGSWTARDWVADVVPHLGFGVTTVATLRALDADEPPVIRARPGLVTRSAVLGLATGLRSSLGFSGPVLTSTDTPTRPDGRAGRLARLSAVLAVGGELVADKKPGTPDRTDPGGLPARLAAAGAGGLALARRERANATLPVGAALAGAAVTTYGGLAYRRWAQKRVPDWQAALAEDAVAVALSWLSCRTSRSLRA